MTLPKFKYFEHPDLFSVFTESETACDTCGETKACFDGTLFYGEDAIEAICPQCLAAGKLEGRDVFTCEGDILTLIEQLKVLYPAQPKQAIEARAREKTGELEEKTPKLVSWQDWPWPCCDGDYCIFLGFGSQALFNSLAEGNDGSWLFAHSLHASVKEAADPDEQWEEVLPAKAVKSYAESQSFDTLFYVFKSLHSDQIITIWDAA